MENFYEFNEEFDGPTAAAFRQQSTNSSMQQPNETNVSASNPVATSASVTSTAVVSVNRIRSFSSARSNMPVWTLSCFSHRLRLQLQPYHHNRSQLPQSALLIARKLLHALKFTLSRSMGSFSRPSSHRPSGLVASPISCTLCQRPSWSSSGSISLVGPFSNQ